MWQKLPYNFLIAVEAIYQNKFRAFLTSLGILFGVASVISMLAIGTGAQQEILEQIRLLGTNNVIITPVVEQEEGKVTEEEDQTKTEKKRFSPGLTLTDCESIENIVPHVDYVSPEVVVETVTIRAGLRRSAKLVGVTSKYFDTSDFILERGNYFSEYQQENSLPVCIIGNSVSAKFFPQEDPIGKRIKAGNLWLTVIGVLERRHISQSNIQHLGIRDFNMDIYTPINTMLLRFRNRAVVTRDDIMAAARNQNDTETLTAEERNYHQLDRLVVRVDEVRYMSTISDVLSRMLERRHNDIVDFQIVIPEMLLEQEKRTRTIFNIVLGAIASISLIVGGIGIMNIMLASVMERIKEIGIRLAIGATQLDILLQFIGEAVSISITGGIAGIMLGFMMSSGIERFTGILTIVSPISVIVSVVVSVSVGLVFGIFPARRAASQDPIVSLRYE
ncbi:MAG TPA: ABC transporter permease [bacterium]|nr:ABC transporter permease [bacterium]